MDMPSDPDTGFIAVAALRYSMGRQTYACGLVAEWLKRYWDTFTDSDRKVLFRNLREFVLGPGPHGAECDKNTWKDLLSWMKCMGRELGDRTHRDYNSHS
jgi:hypothetical protein